MNTLERKYLKKSCQKLAGMLPLTPVSMLKWYAEHEDQYNVEEVNGCVSCLFSFPLLMENGGIIRSIKDLEHGRLEQIILLVYDHE